MNLARLPSRPASALALFALFAFPAAAQTDDIGSIPGRPEIATGDPHLIPGQVATRPDGELFVVDANRDGRAAALRVVDLRWGRRVDVLGLDSSGAIDPRPRLRDFVIGEGVASDGVSYRLIGNLATQVERLVILRAPGAPEPSPGAGTFEELLLAAEGDLTTVPPKDPSAPPPFPQIARNAVLVARMDDLLDDGPQATLAVQDFARLELLAGQGVPFPALVTFDPNHGDIRRGKFHSTRLLVDPAITAFEAVHSLYPVPVNAEGLPASNPGSTASSLVLRLPTREDPGSGQFQVLRNLRGRALAAAGNGPVDPGSPTADLVRGMRTGNETTPFRGFLRDEQPPAVIGDFPVVLDAVSPDPAGEAGFAFLVDLTFPGPCRLRPAQTSNLLVGPYVLEVVVNAPAPDPSGAFRGVRVRVQDPQPASPQDLLGPARSWSPFRTSGLDPACWLGFFPTPASPPSASVSPNTQVGVRFSEAMDAASVSPFDSFRLVRGDGSTSPTPLDVVVAERASGGSRTLFSLAPLVPLAHVQGAASAYHVELAPGPNELTDLAGNPVTAVPTDLVFTLDPLAADVSSGSVALSFTSPDELPGIGAPDLRGNVFLDLERGALRPRPVTTFGVAADRDKPVPSLMVPFAPGSTTPLSPLGSKLQAVWRYADLGWSVRDESKYDVDVVGLSWAPVGGTLVSDFFPQFEIRLAHGRKLPDEDLDANLLPRYPASGFFGGVPFAENVLNDPRGPQKIVHERSLGYAINPASLFVSESGTLMTPFPLNRGDGPIESYTWRDTAVLAEAGPNGAGIPMDVEVGSPLGLEPQAGEVAQAEQVPSIGLPLLMEFRCYPTDAGLGLNALDVSLAINSSAQPAFRAFSTGGINTSGAVVIKDPDLEDLPSGGFNPISAPPGIPTLAADNTFHIGQVDLVTRISRGHSVWIDTEAAAPDYVAVVREGALTAPHTDVQIELRGADGFVGSPTAPFDAAGLDAYGDLSGSTVQFHDGDSTWSSDWNAIDGARYFQVRFTFVGDIDSGAVATLEGLGVVFLR